MKHSQQQSQGDRARQREMTLADLGHFVTDLVSVINKGVADEVTPYSLAPLEFSLLRACMDKGECTATQLALLLPVDASRISRIVHTLVERGLLRRRRLRNDRRIVMLRLSDEGKELVSQIDRRIQAYEAELTKDVSEEEMRIFASIASRIQANHVSMKQPE